MLSRHLLFLLVLAAGPCFADIYKFVDEHGHTVFTDVRVDHRYKLILKDTTRVDKPAALAITPVATKARLSGAVPGHSSRQYADMITKVAQEQKVDAALIHAVISVESAYNSRARSPKGAIGLMQVMPATAMRYGIKDLLNPLENLRAGTLYLRYLLGLFSDDLELTIAAYNAGEGAVMKAGKAIPPYPETRAYVPRVMRFYERYRRAT